MLRRAAAGAAYREAKRKAKEQLPSLFPHAVLTSATGRLQGFSPTGYVYIDFDGVRPAALEPAMSRLCAPDIVTKYGIILVGLSPSARGFRVIARVQPDTYRTLYNAGDEMDCRELLVSAEGIVAELGWHPVKVTAGATVYEEGAVDHSVFSYNRKMYFAPASYVRFGIAEGTVRAMLEDDCSALHGLIDGEMGLRYGQATCDATYKRQWVRSRAAALTGASAAPRRGARQQPATLRRRNALSRLDTSLAADRNPYNSIPDELDILGAPARDFAYVYFTNECRGAAQPPVGARHNMLVTYAALVAPCFEGDYASVRAAMPDFFIGENSDETDDIVRSACAKFGAYEISGKARYTAAIAQNQSIIALQPRLPDALPQWLATLGQKYKDCESNMRMFIMRVFTALASRTTDWQMDGRMTNDTVIPALHTITVTPTSYGKGNVDKLITKCMADKIAEAQQALEDIETNRQARTTAADGKKPKQIERYVPIVNNVTEAAAMKNFASANKLRKRVYFPETDLTRNTITNQKRAWMCEMIKKSSDTSSGAYQMRASDTGTTLACQPCANVDILGVEKNVRWFLQPSIAAANDGLIGRFLYCYLIKSYNPLNAEVPTLHPDPDDNVIRDIVSRVDAPWKGGVPAEIKRFIDDIQKEQIETLYDRASKAYYDFFQRQLDHAYIVACICYRMSGTFGDEEKALTRFVFDESVYSFGAFLEKDINKCFQNSAPTVKRASTKLLDPGVTYTLNDIRTLFGVTKRRAQQILSRWEQAKKISRTKDGGYILNG